MNEADISAKLRVMMTTLGAKVWKVSDRFHASRPDLAICHEGRFIVIEVKIYPNVPTKAQLHELHEIIKAGGVAYVATYNKLDKGLTILDVTYGHSTYGHKDIRTCCQWLLRHRS